MKKPAYKHTYRNQEFTITISKAEDGRWHGYAMFDLGWKIEQVAGWPSPDMRNAYLNARRAGRDHINLR